MTTKPQINYLGEFDLVENGVNIDSLFAYNDAEHQEYYSYRQGLVGNRILSLEGDLAKSLHNILYGVFNISVRNWRENQNWRHKLSHHPDNHETYGLKGLYFQFSDGVCYVGREICGDFN